MKKDSFHHGNLRAEVLKAAMQTLNEKGVEGISLRSIAEDLNVSAGAPYRHFKNKDELIMALAKEGINTVGLSFEQAKNLAGSNEERLSYACMAYLICAEETPHLFKLLLSSDYNSYLLSDTGLEAEENYAYQEFEALIKAVMPEETPNNKSEEITIGCWALLHGFATLHMSGRLETTQYKKQHAINAVIALAKSSHY